MVPFTAFSRLNSYARRDQDGGAGLEPSRDPGPDPPLRRADRSLLAVAREAGEGERSGDLPQGFRKRGNGWLIFSWDFPWFPIEKWQNLDFLVPNLGQILVEHIYRFFVNSI